MPKESLPVWRSTGAQLVLFSGAAESLSAESVYETVIGPDIESSSRNRTMTAASPYLSQAVGQSAGVSYTVQVQPGRIDVFMSAPVEFEVSPDAEIPTLDTALTIDEMLKIVKLTKPLGLMTSRVALVPTLFTPTADYRSAANMIGQIVGNDFDFDGLSDLSVQVARRKKLKSDIEINRLLRANVLAMQQMTARDPSLRIPVFSERLGVSLLVDFNSVPVPMELNWEQYMEVALLLAAELRPACAEPGPFKVVLSDD